jgi:plastocyanin
MHGTVIVGRPDSVAADIEIGDNFFQPQQVSALIGQNVRWINFGSMAHTTTDTSQDYWDSGNLDPGNVFILHAGMVGQFHYICTIHAGMAGVLVVQDTAAGNCFYIPGDINENGQANGVDVGYGVNYFKGFGDAPPVSCPDCPSAGQQLYGAGDVNGNCQFNGVDISYFVNYLKGVGPALSYCISCPPAARQSR